MTHVFGVVSALRMGTCRLSEPLAQGTGVRDQCFVGLQRLSLVDIHSSYSAVGSLTRGKEDHEPRRVV